MIATGMRLSDDVGLTCQDIVLLDQGFPIGEKKSHVPLLTM